MLTGNLAKPRLLRLRATKQTMGGTSLLSESARVPKGSLGLAIEYADSRLNSDSVDSMRVLSAELSA